MPVSVQSLDLISSPFSKSHLRIRSLGVSIRLQSKFGENVSFFSSAIAPCAFGSIAAGTSKGVIIYQPRGDSIGQETHQISSDVLAVDWSSPNLLLAGCRGHGAIWLFDQRSRDPVLRLRHPSAVTKLKHINQSRLVVAGTQDSVSAPFFAATCSPELDTDWLSKGGGEKSICKPSPMLNLALATNVRPPLPQSRAPIIDQSSFRHPLGIHPLSQLPALPQLRVLEPRLRHLGLAGTGCGGDGTSRRGSLRSVDRPHGSKPVDRGGQS